MDGGQPDLTSNLSGKRVASPESGQLQSSPKVLTFQCGCFPEVEKQQQRISQTNLVVCGGWGGEGANATRTNATRTDNNILTKRILTSTNTPSPINRPCPKSSLFLILIVNPEFQSGECHAAHRALNQPSHPAHCRSVVAQAAILRPMPKRPFCAVMVLKVGAHNFQNIPPWSPEPTINNPPASTFQPPACLAP